MLPHDIVLRNIALIQMGGAGGRGEESLDWEQVVSCKYATNEAIY